MSPKRLVGPDVPLLVFAVRLHRAAKLGKDVDGSVVQLLVGA